MLFLFVLWPHPHSHWWKEPKPENLDQDFLSSPGPSAFPKQGLICLSTRCVNHAFKLPPPPHTHTKLLRISHRHPLLLSYALLTCLSPTHSSLFHSLHSSGRHNSPRTTLPLPRAWAPGILHMSPVLVCQGSVPCHLHRQACCDRLDKPAPKTPSTHPHTVLLDLQFNVYKVLDWSQPLTLTFTCLPFPTRTVDPESRGWNVSINLQHPAKMSFNPTPKIGIVEWINEVMSQLGILDNPWGDLLSLEIHPQMLSYWSDRLYHFN